MKRSKIFGMLALLLMFSVGLAGCVKTKAASKTKIVFWNEMTGPAEVQLDKFAKQFNASQSKYEVVPEYEGSYNGVVQKIIQTHGSGASPALFQSFDISTTQLGNLKLATPVQKFIDRDNYDMSKIMPVAKKFYSKNGQQLSMPFNTSQPVLYYNASLLKRLGIKNPPKDPSYSDITRVATQIIQKSHGKIKGLSVEEYAWLLEEFMANQKEEFANHDNGRSSTPTAVKIDTPAARTAMQWVRDNIKKGNFMNYGSGSNAAANEMAAFLSGKLGIFLQSSADIGQITAGTKDKLGVTFYPHADGHKANGVAIGGASLWISNDKPKNVQNGAWEFTKFLMKPENQAKWQEQTGYMALNKESQKTDTLKNLYKKVPAAKVPSEQLARTVPNDANSGILLEGLVQERVLTQTAMQQIYGGSNISDSLKTAEDGMNTFIKNNNKANGY
ncbi:ABC transporter substrate-binding protein [Lentilactobacillus sp. Marseille-Q4993]|uniref:ABC transporter substrate-binding protein n=1 Tax=Lentilactobacillus sp. Marseille-Q4993 TaxID=3039492 RepID=UPI0024BC367F|nr:ABC transporter substrate-binding protein [Lentilactobacillus sp. Marseille-Q4993]